jgi:hypothetical protein
VPALATLAGLDRRRPRLRAAAPSAAPRPAAPRPAAPRPAAPRPAAPRSAAPLAAVARSQRRAACALTAIAWIVLGAAGLERAASAAPAEPGPAPARSTEPGAISPSPGAAPGGSTDALGAGDPREVERAIAAITGLPASQSSPDVLFAAARACEDKLFDPGRAAAIYQRILTDHATARVATAAARRLAALRALIGVHGEAAPYATALAQLVAHADAQPPGAVLLQGARLATADWPGAPAAALWLADWLRRSGRLLEAQAHYARVVARWPDRVEARAALRGGAGCALDAHDWALAEALARRLPIAEAADQVVRDELLGLAARGRRRDRGAVAAWLAIAGAFAALACALAVTVVRSPPGTRRAVLRPPIEIVFLAPIALVFLGVAFTAHRAIAPAVAIISLGGLGLAWLSGATLEQLRAHGRAHSLRSLAHIVLCLAGVAGLVYVALTRDNLIDSLIETVRFGPDP